MMTFSKKYARWIVPGVGLVLVSVFASFLPVGLWLKSFVGWFQGLGVLGAFIYIGLYTVAAVLFLPGAIFTIAAGLIYGIAGGTAVALTGATIGAALAFLIARYLLRERIARYAERNRRFGAIDEAVGRQGWKIVGLLRLSPLIPFNVSNYFYGLTSIGFWPYVLASAIGMLPGTLLFAYLGAIGKASIGGAGGEQGHSPIEWTFLGVGLLVTVGVTVFVGRLAKRALKNKGPAQKE
jgi:uncharacterized membrane protein YdjX (TVP38/TMEM64 family)